MSNLLIVESPAKNRTIQKYLGDDFEVFASYGHVRDLVSKTGAVDPAQNFKMRYAAIERNAKHVQEIQKAMKRCDTLYLATDPDREGEAISWHLYEMLKENGCLKGKKVYRIVFHEITQNAIQEAIASPRELSMDLVNAQQARRALDHLVGFTLSPLLWKKIRRGLSAGRVQSPALRLIVEREAEITAFVQQEYWTVEADCASAQTQFSAKLTQFQGKKCEQFDWTNRDQAEAVKAELLTASAGRLLVEDVQRKQRKRNPSAPFITSTLQQEASRKLGFTARKTMQVAQSLYEGVNIGDGEVGLITYMRTDSLNLSNDAISNIREFIETTYGEKDLPSSPRVFKNKVKNAQEAHEAIRPTDVNRTPDKVGKKLNTDQQKLYRLIWQRAVASQMVHATINTVAIDLTCANHVFRANGSTIADPGFMKLYIEGLDDHQVDEDAEALLPHLEKGQYIDCLGVRAEQHFTEPPPRYTEATLVKVLEEFGIGRPSTYATIIATLQAREYAELRTKRFFPTDVGVIVSRFLTDYFTRYVDFDFTAKLEDKLDSVSRGELAWVELLQEFWTPFFDQVKEIEATVQRKDVTQETLEEKCPECSKPLSIRLGKRGRFVGCSGYPECTYTRPLEVDPEAAAEPEPAPEILEGRVCPACENPLIFKKGRYGKFIGCSTYPKCKHMEPLVKPKETGILCPECQAGDLLERKSRFGKLFYSCNTYPKCQYAVWNPPLKEVCPNCRWPVLTIKTTKRRGTEKVCPQKNCGYTASAPELAPKEEKE